MCIQKVGFCEATRKIHVSVFFGGKRALSRAMVVSAGSKNPDKGPVVQSFVSLTSSLVVKILTVLVSTISNSQVFLLKKCE